MNKETLKQLVFWSAMTESEQESLSIATTVRIVPKGTILFHEKEKGGEVYLLITGNVLLKQSTGGREDMIIHMVNPGELFGETLISKPACYEYRAETMEHSKVALIPLAAFLEILQNNAKITFYFFQLMIDRLQKAESKFFDFRYHRTEKRIREVLRQIMMDKGHRLVSGEWEISGRLTHQLIGGLSLSSRQSVSFFLNHFKREGIIRYDRRRMIIHRPDLL